MNGKVQLASLHNFCSESGYEWRNFADTLVTLGGISAAYTVVREIHEISVRHVLRKLVILFLTVCVELLSCLS